jgi:glucose-6-phosphate isomerase
MPDYMKPFSTDFDLMAGVMLEPDTVIERRTSQMSGYYQSEEALAALVREGDDPIHYEVFEKDIPEEQGHLRVCISKLYPGTVDDECFMTKGHYHTVSGTAELYLGLRGQGLMLMKTPEGECTWEEFQPGRMIYVPPHWAHRSINTGQEPLVSFCVYPGEAGHNYGDIEEEGFPRRVFLRDGKVEIV